MQFVYVMKSSAGLVKVGISIDVERRRRQLESAGGHMVEVVEIFGPFKCAARLEAAVHQRLASVRAKGEWFSCEPQDACEAVRVESMSHDDSLSKNGGLGTDSLAEAGADPAGFSKWAAEQFIKPALDAMQDAEKAVAAYGDLVSRYSALTDEFLESVEMMDDYRNQVVSLLALGRELATRNKALEAEVVRLRGIVVSRV